MGQQTVQFGRKDLLVDRRDDLHAGFGGRYRSDRDVELSNDHGALSDPTQQKADRNQWSRLLWRNVMARSDPSPGSPDLQNPTHVCGLDHFAVGKTGHFKTLPSTVDQAIGQST